MHKISFKYFILACVVLMITSCSTEKNYRGVPEPSWQQLSAEQKQLIVDHSFHEEFQNA